MGRRSSIYFIAEHATEPCVREKGVARSPLNLKCYNMTINADHGRSAPIGPLTLVELSEHSRIREVVPSEDG